MHDLETIKRLNNEAAERAKQAAVKEYDAMQSANTLATALESFAQFYNLVTGRATPDYVKAALKKHYELTKN